MRVLSTVPWTLRRMSRDYLVLLLLLGVPIVLLSLFSYLMGNAMAESGRLLFHDTAQQMIMSFQLFSGSVVMSYLYYDLFTEKRMRIFTLPFNKSLYAFSIMLCGTVYSLVLGVLLMTYAQLVLGVVWEHWVWMSYNLLLLSVVSSIVSLILMFSVRSFKTAERLTEIYGVGFIVLAGLFFPMPDNAVMNFLGSYGNPLTLSDGAVTAMANGEAGEAWLQANVLAAASLVLFPLMLLLGRRKMR
ncbi:hypothetical protein [Paenibacillus daejeonensis]|uniref:hypothetical protein n=1 Tax=Paenibacillus daejeonensis TaxID=135193 RepID=UPI0003764C7B|nr:hypothetical protein [Paenibacillus daejeonensis]